MKMNGMKLSAKILSLLIPALAALPASAEETGIPWETCVDVPNSRIPGYASDPENALMSFNLSVGGYTDKSGRTVVWHIAFRKCPLDVYVDAADMISATFFPEGGGEALVPEGVHYIMTFADSLGVKMAAAGNSMQQMTARGDLATLTQPIFKTEGMEHIFHRNR